MIIINLEYIVVIFAVIIIISLEDDVVLVVEPKLITFCNLGVRAKNALFATVDLLLVDKVLMVEAKANKVKSKDKDNKEEEEEVAIRLRRKSRCLEVNWQSCSRSWKGWLMIVLSAKKNLLWIIVLDFSVHQQEE